MIDIVVLDINENPRSFKRHLHMLSFFETYDNIRKTSQRGLQKLTIISEVFLWSPSFKRVYRLLGLLVRKHRVLFLFSENLLIKIFQSLKTDNKLETMALNNMNNVQIAMEPVLPRKQSIALMPATKDDINNIDPRYLLMSFKIAVRIYVFDWLLRVFSLNIRKGIKCMAK